MASEVLVNGNHSQHNGHPAEQQHNPQFTGQQQYSQASQSGNAAAPSANGQNADIPKDEVGWYFVEQYYTTLSKSPDRLYLYYNKRSQFVSGNETDKVQVCVGQRAINDRIKELDFHDCKVRITNVDSQASDQNIVIQVIGEIANKSQPHRKFTQTFVLATQTNGYFVLNDIFRYIIQEEDEAPETQTEDAVTSTAEQTSEPTPAPKPAAIAVPEHTTMTSSTDPSAVEHDAEEVDQEIEKNLVNGTAHPEVAAEEPAKAEVSETPERPTEPEPTPIPSPQKQAPAQPAAATSKPSAPKSWASMAASAANKSGGGPKPVVPAVPNQRTSQSAKSNTVPTAPAAQTEANAGPTPVSAPREDTATPATTSDSQDEWTAVGGSHARQQSRQVNAPQQQEGPQRRGYIKNVRDNTSGPDLREALEKYGKIVYFDISQQKVSLMLIGNAYWLSVLIINPQNCAFVDFETPEGYQAAVSANPHVVGSDSFNVEERKMRPGSTPYVPRGQYQGGRGGRGDFRGGRGNFNPRGRGQGNARGGSRGGATQLS